MTTLSIPLDDAVARQLEAQGAEAGKTPVEYAREVLNRVAGLSAFQALVEKNEARLRAEGYGSEAEASRAIDEGIEEVRRDR